MFHVNLKCVDDSYVSLFATEIPTICAPVYRPDIPLHVLQSFEDLSIEADCSDGGEVQIDVLIGLDAYWKFMKAGIVRGPEGLVAQESVFGWVLSGSLLDEGGSSPVVSHQLLCFNEVPEAALHKFWDLESIGICDAPVEDADVSTVFKQHIKYVDGRYEVGFPWKPGMADTLQDNEKLARVRLDSLCRKLDKDTDLQCRYNSVLQEMENDGIIEEVPVDQKVSPHPATFYMPHRPVVKESSSTTKVRPVFDASAAGRNGVSLNDCMEAGPNLMPNLPEILIRFRRRKIALTADITKAFLQVKISDSDRDVSRFLWKLDGTVRVMRFTRVPFGNKSSPFF